MVVEDCVVIEKLRHPVGGSEEQSSCYVHSILNLTILQSYNLTILQSYNLIIL